MNEQLVPPILQQQRISPEGEKRFREYLQAEFVRRCRSNKTYSMRAFARDIDIDQSLLSKLLRNKRQFSIAIILKVSQRLSLTEDQVAGYLNECGEDAHQLEDDMFQVISDWYHFAILELMKLPQFESNTNWIAETLGIEVLEIEKALERLQRLDFIELENSELKLVKSNNQWASFESTNQARKKLQQELSVRSAEAVDDIEFHKREHASLTTACDPKLLPQVKKKIDKFWRELDEYILSEGEVSEVYQLTIGFFPLTNLGDKYEQIN